MPIFGGSIIGIVIALVCIVLAVAITALVTKNLAVERYKAEEAAKVGNAEHKAREIIDQALKTAETKNPRSEGQRFSDTRSECCLRRKLWIRSRKS